MAIQTILVINKSGGLVYKKEFLNGGHRLTSNEYLVLAGTLQGVIAIAGQLTPKALQITKNSGIKDVTDQETLVAYAGPLGILESQDMGSFMLPDYFTESFKSWNTSGLKHITTDQLSLFVFQSLTGVKLVAISTQNSISNVAVSIAENLLRKVYCLYADYVMKNPFHEAEMPIKCTLFDKKVAEMVSRL
ncbi:LAMI_0H05028g1_1 [Lachancea mirantina]|uniref:Trafficking protein particle complex subunit n=1 Tax=Lachancea mirantina TaxID=1230905 RepID=A0A1G4KF04_9SACH|nr:LAMI_0H05028g1_1 [Lachancea mirantina]